MLEKLIKFWQEQADQASEKNGERHPFETRLVVDVYRQCAKDLQDALRDMDRIANDIEKR